MKSKFLQNSCPRMSYTFVTLFPTMRVQNLCFKVARASCLLMNYGSVIKSFYHLSCLATPAVTFILKLEQSQTTQEYLQVTLLFISLVLLNSVMQFLYRHFLQFFTKTRVYEAIPQHTAVTWNRPQMISFFHSVTNKSLFSFVPTACLQMTSSGHA